MMGLLVLLAAGVTLPYYSVTQPYFCLTQPNYCVTQPNFCVTQPNYFLPTPTYWASLPYNCSPSTIIPLKPMGIIAHRLRMLDRPLVPPSAWAEIFRRTCLQSHLQTSPQTPQKSYPKFRNPRTAFENTPLCPCCLDSMIFLFRTQKSIFH